MRKVRRGERRTRAGARSYLAILLLFKELDHPLGLVLEEVANQREGGGPEYRQAYLDAVYAWMHG